MTTIFADLLLEDDHSEFAVRQTDSRLLHLHVPLRINVKLCLCCYLSVMEPNET
jgi:hypothetical protein